MSSDPSVDGLIAAQARRAPDAVAVEDEHETLSYRELLARADGVAAGLRDAGVQPGDTVAAYVQRSAKAIATLLGILRAGAAYVPLDPADPPARHDMLIKDSRPRVVLPLDPPLSAGPVSSQPGGERLAYVLYTSGSTGRPKGVEVTHGNVLTLLLGGSDVVPREDDVVLHVTPLTFDVSVLEVWGALVHGARLVIAPHGRPDPREVGRLVRERGVTFAGPAAGVLARLVDDALPDLAGLRIAVPSGDVLPPATARRLREAHPHVRLVNAYGPTETTVLCTAYEVDAVEGAVPIGRALPGYEARVAEDGELLIGGPAVARGYRANEAATAERFVDGWYRTGDRVREDADGVLHYLGRLDRQVKLGGVRVEPGEVEHALAAHPDVAQAAVTVREAVAGHRQLVAYAAPVPGASLDGEALRRFLEERLPRAYVPAVVVVLEQMPLTGRGKVDREALPAPAAASSPAAAPDVARVAAVMGDLLGGAAPGADDDFFALGGDSLLAIALVGRLRAAGHAGLGVGAVFEQRTPRRLAAALAATGGPSLPPIAARAGRGPAPLTGAQRRAWLFGELNPGARAYQHAGLVRIDGALDVPALRTALDRLVERHEALRSSIVVRDGEPLQRVHERVELPLEELDLRGAPATEYARAVRARVRVRIDPASAPWVRWTLIRLGEERWALLCLEHHLAHDGWSLDVLTRELGVLLSGAAPPPPALQIGDVGAWEAENGRSARRPARPLGRGARPGSSAARAAVRPVAGSARVVRRRRRPPPARRRDRPPRRRARRAGGSDAVPGLPRRVRRAARALRRARGCAGRLGRRQPRRPGPRGHARDARQHDRAAHRPVWRPERARACPAGARRGHRRPLVRRRPIRPCRRAARAAARPLPLAARAGAVLVPRHPTRRPRMAGPRRTRGARAPRRHREGRSQRDRRAARRRVGELRVGAR